MTGYLKITPPKGFEVVVPDTLTVRAQYEKLNAALERTKETQYKIEEATAAEVKAFNPAFKVEGAKDK